MCIVGCCAAPAQVDKILDSFYEYMDDRDRWQEAGVVKVRWPPAAGPNLRQLVTASCATAPDGLAVTQQAAWLGRYVVQVAGTDRVSQTGEPYCRGNTRHLVPPPSCDLRT